MQTYPSESTMIKEGYLYAEGNLCFTCGAETLSDVVAVESPAYRSGNLSSDFKQAHAKHDFCQKFYEFLPEFTEAVRARWETTAERSLAAGRLIRGEN